MSGLLALLDDVAALAKLAAVHVDDVALQAGKAGSKAAAVVIDDSAVTPKYVHGLPAARELPIVWRIARGSLFNKLVILLPAALLLHLFAPAVLGPLLMLGGAYLCYEGGEKVLHWLHPGAHGDAKASAAQSAQSLDAARLEEQRISGAIKTDFILSAEIMTIALSAIDAGGFAIQAAALAAVAIGITALVYGSVAVLVKADDVGLAMAQDGYFGATRMIGRQVVRAMPRVMAAISTIGTVAMLWVGGAILIHGLAGFGLAGPEHLIHAVSEAFARLPGIGGVLGWSVGAVLDAAVGLAAGIVLVPLVQRVVLPIADRLRGR